jgi:hypothetical protein
MEVMIWRLALTSCTELRKERRTRMWSMTLLVWPSLLYQV